MTVNELSQRTREYDQHYDHNGKMFHGPQHGTPAAVYINQFWMVRTHVSLATKCNRKGKNRGPTGTGTQSLSLSVRQLSNWAIWPTSDIFPCLNRFVPANLLGTTEEQTRHTFLMLVVPAVTLHWATICHGRGKNRDRDPTRIRTNGYRLPHEHCAYWATEPLGRPCFIRFVLESARNETCSVWCS